MAISRTVIAFLLICGLVQAEVVRHKGIKQECVNGRCVQVTGYATAFSIGNSRGCSYWLTVAHGVPTMTNQWLEISGQRYECSTITRRKDQLYDYALIRCDGYTAREVYCLPATQVVGPVSVTGYPETRTDPVTLQTTFAQSNDKVGPQRLYKAYGTYVQGWSGAPALVVDRNGNKTAVGVLGYSDGTCTPTAYIRREIAQYVPGGFQCEVAPPPPIERPTSPQPCPPQIDAPLPKVPDCNCPKPNGLDAAALKKLADRLDELEKAVAKHEVDSSRNFLSLTKAVEDNRAWIKVEGGKLVDNSADIEDLQDRLDRLQDYKREVQMVDPSGKVYSSRRYGWDEPIRLYGVVRSKGDDQ